MNRVLAFGLLAGLLCGCSATTESTTTAPKAAIVDAEDPSSCPVADARGGTRPVPWNDPARMKDYEGLAPRSSAAVSIQWPKDDDVLDKGTGTIQYKVTGYEIGRDEKSHFQHCRIVLDNTGFANDHDGKTTLESLNGGQPLAEGSHLLSIFPVRSSGISLKNDGACAQVKFHVKSKRGKLPAGDTEQLIYNLPDGTYDSSKGEAHNIVCDFQLKAVTMDKTVDRQTQLLNIVVEVTDPAGKVEKLPQINYAPFILLRDPKPGTYKLKMWLEERDDGDIMDLPFGEPTHEITVK